MVALYRFGIGKDDFQLLSLCCLCMIILLWTVIKIMGTKATILDLGHNM